MWMNSKLSWNRLSPAHLRFVISGITWGDLESLELTWGYFDENPTTWGEFESMFCVHKKTEEG